MPGASQTRATWAWFAVVIGLGSALLFVGLGETEFRVYDEGLYGKLARYAAHHDTYLHAVDAQGEFDAKFSKPPLSIWLVAASFRLLGHSLFALRLPFALGMLGLVCVAFGWGRRIAGLPMAVGWSLALLATAATLRWGRHACIEPLFLAPIVGALWAYHEATIANGRRARRLALAAGALLAIAFMTKQLAVGIAVFPIVGIEMLRRDRSATLRRLVPTLAVPLAVAALWFASAYRQVGDVVFTIVRQGVGQRLQGFVSGHNTRSMAELGRIVVEACAPFSWPLAAVALLLLAVHSVKDDWRDPPPTLLLPLFFVGLVLVYANVSSSMLPWYAADFVPPLCAGLGWSFAMALRVRDADQPWTDRAAGIVGLTALGTGAVTASTAVMSPLNAAVGLAFAGLVVARRAKVLVPALLGVAAFIFSTRTRHVEFHTDAGPFTDLMNRLDAHDTAAVVVARSTGLVSGHYATFFGPTATVSRQPPWSTGLGDAWVAAVDLPEEFVPPPGVQLLRTPGGIAVFGSVNTPPYRPSTISDLLDAGPVSFEAEHLAGSRRRTIARDDAASGSRVRQFSPFRTEAVPRFNLVNGPRNVPLRSGRYALDLFAQWSCGGVETDAMRVTMHAGKKQLARRDLRCDESPGGLENSIAVPFRVAGPAKVSVTVRYDYGEVTVDRIVLRRLR